MPDLIITASAVAKGANAVLQQQYVAGETITAGMCVYLKTTDSKWYKAKSSGTTEEATVQGVALHGSLAGQPLAVQTSGPITIGAAVAVGVFYVVSATAGGIAPMDDLVATNKVSVIGYATTVAIIQISPILTGVAL